MRLNMYRFIWYLRYTFGAFLVYFKFHFIFRNLRFWLSPTINHWKLTVQLFLYQNIYFLNCKIILIKTIDLNIKSFKMYLVLFYYYWINLQSCLFQVISCERIHKIIIPSYLMRKNTRNNYSKLSHVKEYTK